MGECSTTKRATHKQVLWLADLLAALDREVTPRAIEDMKMLTRQEIRIQTERVYRVVAQKQGTRFPHIERVIVLPDMQQSSHPGTHATNVRHGSARRSDAINTVGCPTCHTPPGRPCLTNQPVPQTRSRLHQERWAAFAGV